MFTCSLAERIEHSERVKKLKNPYLIITLCPLQYDQANGIENP